MIASLWKGKVWMDIGIKLYNYTCTCDVGMFLYSKTHGSFTVHACSTMAQAHIVIHTII